MDEYYVETYFIYIHMWFTQQIEKYRREGICVNKHPKRNNYSFAYGNLIGELNFWDKECIIEQIIQNKDTKELLYYLHYRVTDLHTCTKFINDFHKTLIKSKEVIHIGIVCSFNTTSSLFVDKLQKLNDMLHLDYKFEVVDLLEIEKLGEHYHLIMLAPQIQYFLPKLNALNLPCKIKAFDTTVFATMNYRAAIEMIERIVKEDK